MVKFYRFQRRTIKNLKVITKESMSTKSKNQDSNKTKRLK